MSILAKYSLLDTYPRFIHILFISFLKGMIKVYYFYGYPNPYYNNMYIYPDERQLYFNSMMRNHIQNNENLRIKDYGGSPFVVNIKEASIRNKTYRTAIWTGEHLQVTLMSINVGDDIGLEVHPNTDQFLRIEQGQGIVRMGGSKEDLNFEKQIHDNSAIFVPAGTWHNVINTGNKPLKLYSIYAPPNHPFGTVQASKSSSTPVNNNSNKEVNVFGMTPDEWIMHTEYLVNEGLEDVKRGINATHILQEFILMGVLVGKGYSPEKAYETVEEWERTGESKLLQQSKNM